MIFASSGRALGASLLLASLALACSSTTPSAPGDAGTPDASADASTARDAAAPTDASTDAEAGPADAGEIACDIGADPANLPAITSRIVIGGGDAGDAGAAPTGTGGDEVGLWVYTRIELYVGAGAPLDAAASKIEGTGWIELTGTTFRQRADTVTTLATTIAGDIVRGSDLRARGTYTKTGSTFAFTPTCRSGADGTQVTTYSFSRLDATHARLILDTQTQLGAAVIVTELEKRS